MMNNVVGIFGLLVWMCGSWLWARQIIARIKMSLVERVLSVVGVMVVGYGVLVLQLNRAGLMLIDKTSLWLVLLGLLIVGWVLGKKLWLKDKGSKEIIKDSVGDKAGMAGVVSLVVVVGFAVFYMLLRYEPIVGGDSPNYVSDSAQVLISGKVEQEFDRGLVKMLPAVISLILNVELEIAVKLMAVGILVGSGLVMYVFARQMVEKRWAVLAMTLTYLSIPVWVMSLGVYANLFGYVMEVGVLWWIMKFKIDKVLWWGVLGMLWGVLFQVHGLVAYSSLIVVSASLLVILLSRASQFREWKRILLGMLVAIVVFGVVSFPFFSKGLISVSRGVVNPVLNKLETTDELEKVKETSGSAVVKKSRPVLKDGVVKNKPHWSDFPVRRRVYADSFSVSWLVLAMIGIWRLVRLETLSSKKERGVKWVLVVGFLVSFVITQQELLGISWFVSRFVWGMFVWIVMLAVVGLRSFECVDVSKFKLKNKHIWIFVVVFLVLPEGIRVVKYVNGAYVPTIETGEYRIFKDVRKLTEMGITVYSTSTKPGWFLAVNPDDRVISLREEAICRSGIKFRQYQKMWKLSAAVSWVEEVPDWFDVLKKEAGGKSFGVLIDETSNCVDLDKFESGKFEVVSRWEHVRLVVSE